MKIPEKFKIGETLKKDIGPKLNDLVDYVKSLKPIGDGENIIANPTPSGTHISLRRRGSKAGGGEEPRSYIVKITGPHPQATGFLSNTNTIPERRVFLGDVYGDGVLQPATETGVNITLTSRYYEDVLHHDNSASINREFYIATKVPNELWINKDGEEIVGTMYEIDLSQVEYQKIFTVTKSSFDGGLTQTYSISIDNEVYINLEYILFDYINYTPNTHFNFSRKPIFRVPVPDLEAMVAPEKFQIYAYWSGNRARIYTNRLDAVKTTALSGDSRVFDMPLTPVQTGTWNQDLFMVLATIEIRKSGECRILETSRHNVSEWLARRYSDDENLKRLGISYSATTLAMASIPGHLDLGVSGSGTITVSSTQTYYFRYSDTAKAFDIDPSMPGGYTEIARATVRNGRVVKITLNVQNLPREDIDNQFYNYESLKTRGVELTNYSSPFGGYRGINIPNITLPMFYLDLGVVKLGSITFVGLNLDTSTYTPGRYWVYNFVSNFAFAQFMFVTSTQPVSGTGDYGNKIYFYFDVGLNGVIRRISPIVSGLYQNGSMFRVV
jgi:hypothetical protein